MRLFRALLLVSALLASAVPVGAADPYEIDGIAPLSGPAQFVGQGLRASLTALETTINKGGGIGGRPVKFVLYDDQANPQIAVQLANQLMAKKVPVFLGPSLTSTCSAVAPLINAANGPVMFCFGAPNLPDNPYLYAAVSVGAYSGAALRYMRGKNLNRIAMLSSTDATGLEWERYAQEGVARPDHGSLTVVAAEHFNPGDLSVAAQLEHIKATHPDVICVWTTGTPLATALRGIKDAGLDDIPIFTTPVNASVVLMHQFAAYLPKLLLMTGSSVLAPDRVTDRATIARLHELAAAMAPQKPDAINLGGWDPGLIVVEALRKAGTDATAQQLRDAINNNRVVGAEGHYDFKAIPGRGIGQDAVYVVRWDPAADAFVGVSKASGVP